MEENKMAEQNAENTVEQPVEEVVEESVELTDTSVEEPKQESVKTYTEEELNKRVDELLAKKIGRERRKIEKEYQSKYSDYDQLASVVRAGLGTDDLKEATSKLEDFYTNEGINIPKFSQRPSLTEREETILANAEANEIIELGEALDEANRLANKGVANMTSREKLIFNTLATHLNAEKKKSSLNELGLSNLYGDKDFDTFANQFNSKTDIKEIANLYMKIKPKREVEQIGSLTNNSAKEPKNFYSKEDVDKMSEFEISKNLEVIKESMLKW